MKEMILVLHHAIYEEEYFSLHYLNSRIEHIELGYTEESDRPSPIKSKSLKARDTFSLSQSGMFN